MNKKVVIAMSGGVDSSVAAALLVKRGFGVIGLFMKLWSDSIDTCQVPRQNRCCDLAALEDARQVAAHLKIPFYVINLEKEFRQLVVDNFLSEYAAGRTPNPCVICNREIKFDLLYRKAQALGADFFATGHYVRLRDANWSNWSNLSHWPHLLKAEDNLKDQSYMLWGIKKEILPHLLFPIGDPPAGGLKAQVRTMAKKWRLPSHSKPESQEICFVASEYRQFLQKYIPEAFQPGPIKDKKGNIIGEHQGLPLYTIGQRKQVPIAAQSPTSQPFYVLEIDPKNNTLIVGRQRDLYKKELIVEEANWLSPVKRTCQATIRYRHPAEDCQLKIIGEGRIKVGFDRPQRAITPGQSAVFYQGKQLLGGGIIR